ncbi:hypothetical protein [Alteromonas sp. C1M14]|uniref:CC0125/CC1285 family lipoprotein n=1 Tax=Alteromonas sp. C1M14 TaxID=2841567 RepID=UPI001C081905|nr:hypothetical protein [Alteromonas sp. C1M14]MBU2977176.1 hypothetical protein [Alteromonas sp. C1M14]
MDMTFFQLRLRRGIFALTAASSFVLMGCVNLPDSTATPFQSASTHEGYGYSSVQLSDTEYRIMFRATESTDASKVQEYTLFRAAQIAQQQKYSWVTIVKTDVERKAALGKHTVEAEKSKNNALSVFQNEQCSMSGCTEIAQPFPTNSGMTIETEVMKDVYYSILVRMSDATSRPDAKAFDVSTVLSHPVE